MRLVDRIMPIPANEMHDRRKWQELLWRSDIRTQAVEQSHINMIAVVVRRHAVVGFGGLTVECKI